MMRCVWVSISTLLLFSLRPTVGSIEAGLEGARPPDINQSGSGPQRGDSNRFLKEHCRFLW